MRYYDAFRERTDGSALDTAVLWGASATELASVALDPSRELLPLGTLTQVRGTLAEGRALVAYLVRGPVALNEGGAPRAF